MAAKDIRHEEVHERPELHHIVLERCASQEESSLSVEPEKRLPSLTLEVLDVLRLIQYHIVPLLASEGEVVLNH